MQAEQLERRRREIPKSPGLRTDPELAELLLGRARLYIALELGTSDVRLASACAARALAALDPVLREQEHGWAHVALA